MKSPQLIILSALLMIASACTQQTSYTSNTHVTSLVPEDVYEVLPKSDLDIMVYNDSSEIDGEYFELAMIEVEETVPSQSSAQIMDSLKNEVKKLGGNGVLVLQNTNSVKGNSQTQSVKAMVVYALDRRYSATHPLASL